ncbi:MAG: hypothetical protein ACMXYA_01860, partial [Candidatus Woesearchaeota archaeon]
MFQITKPLPDGISMQGQTHYVNDSQIQFFADNTFMRNGEQITEQEIFPHIFSLIANSTGFVLVDMFLFNADYDENIVDKTIPITGNLTQHLIDRQTQNDSDIFVITDYLNTLYGSYEDVHFEAMRNAHIPVVKTRLDVLRDSNPLYSTFYRLVLQHLTFLEHISLPHPLGVTNEQTTLSHFFTLLNFKANHRKILVTQEHGTYHTFITSANPHEASSLHSNIGFHIQNSIAQDVLESERAILQLSSTYTFDIEPVQQTTGNIGVTFLTEKK